VRVIGVDPGPTTGIVLLRYPGRPSCYQCHGIDAPGLVSWLIDSQAAWPRILLAIEAFQAGRGPGARTSDGALTRAVIDSLLPLGDWKARSAGVVKPWSTDERLDKANLLCPGMRHAQDAARIALYEAVKSGQMPDPLSRNPGL